jgi:predicted dehydrogenase
VKIGLVGLGFMGVTHLGAYAKIPGTEVTAISCRDPKTLEGDFSNSGGNLEREPQTFDLTAAKKYTVWRELIRDPNVEVVDICLPTDLHVTVAVEALSAGKHVLCEKPMAMTTEGCERMAAAAAQYKRTLMVAQVLRFWPEYMALERFVREKEYGAVRAVTLTRRCGVPDWSGWLLDEKRSGGAIVDLLIHDIDQALLLFGEPEAVAAKKLAGVDALTATLLYPGGPEVRLQGGWFAAGMPFSMSFQARAERAELELGPEGLTLNRVPFAAEGGDGYEAELAYFLECCKSGRPPELCMPEASAQAVKLALLLKRSRENDGERIKCSD